ncbi:MAG: DNA polymerase III subunit delta [Pseudomonadota bacterium]
MRLYPNKLDAHLSQSLQPVYLISGDEPLQMMESADKIRARARELGYSGREVFVVDHEFRWNDLLASSDAMSLFAEQRLLELRLEAAKPGREGSKALCEYAARPAEDAVLLVLSGKIDRAGQSSAWYKALDKIGVTMQVWPVAAADLPGWVAQRMRQRGMHPTLEATQLIAERVEGNMLAAQQEIDILRLLYNDAEIGAPEVLSVVGDNARYQTFDLADAALIGNTKRVVTILDGLRAEGIDAVPTLMALTSQLRTLMAITWSVAGGASVAQAMKDARVWQNRQEIFQRALRRHQPAQWEALLLRSAELELLSKGFNRRGDVWDELLELASVIAGQGTLQKTQFSTVV